MEIIGIGEVVWDCLPESKKLGEAPINFRSFVKELGTESYPVVATDEDEPGDGTSVVFREIRLDSGHVSRSILSAGKMLAPLNETGVPQYDIVESVAWDAIRRSPVAMKLIDDVGAVCWGSLAQRSEELRAAILRLIDAMPDTSLKVLDINIRQHSYPTDLIVESSQKANVLKLDEDELPLLISLPSLSTDFVEVIIELIACFSLRHVIFIRGTVRSDIYDMGREISSINTPKVEVADTIGVGDSFTATSVVNILRRASVTESHCKAADVSTYTCTQGGATSPLPDSKR